MDDLMARTMIENLSIGINPLTGETLPRTDICTNEIVQEAIQTVLAYCSIDSYATILEKQRKEKKEKAEQRKKERIDRYPNQGKPWRENEDRKLIMLYRERYAIPHIANILKRSPTAVASRLKRIGLIQ